MRNRRQFIKNISLASTGSLYLSMATLSATTLLSGCSTVDDYLITNPSDLGNQVAIIGGGITGLYAAYQLKKRKIPYRIFELSSRLGGKIMSDQNLEYGAFEFSNQDKNLLALAKDLNLKTEKTDSKNWVFKNGTSDFLSQLIDRIGGVLPDQKIKLNNRLIGLDKNSHQFRLTFSTLKSDKTYTANQVLLAVPWAQLKTLQGVNPPDRLSFKTQTIRSVRVVFFHEKPDLKINIKKYKSFAQLGLNCEVRTHQGMVYVTLFGDAEGPEFPQEIEQISLWIAENIFDVSAGSLDIKPENIYIWTTAYVVDDKNYDEAMISRPIVISDGYTVGDLTKNILSDTLNQHRIENLLISVNKKIDQFL